MTSLVSADSNPRFLQSSPCAGAQAGGLEIPGDLSTRALLDSLFEAALLCRNGKIAHANPAACTLFGLPSEILAGKSLFDFIVIGEELRNDALSISRASENAELSATLLCQNARPVGVALRTVACTPSDHGHLLFIRERNEHAPAMSGRTLMELLPWPMMQLDAEMNYIQSNSSLSRKLAPFVRLSEGKPLEELGWPASFCRELKKAVSLESKAGTLQLPLEWQLKRRHHRFVAEVLPERDPHGSLRSLLVVIHESPRSEKKDASTRLRHAQEAHEHVLAASHARDAFFGWVSHELRTPLNGIQSWAHILETCVGAASDSPLITRALHGIRTGIDQQLRLIEELVDVSRVIQGKLPLTRHTFALTPVAQSAAESLRTSALSRQVGLACRYPAEEMLLESDPCRVQQALHLLLSHAVERSPRDGTVSFSILRRRGNVAMCIAHRCGDGVGHANRLAGAMVACHKDARQQMNLLLARCLAERLGGGMKTRLSRRGDEASYTLLLPLSGGAGIRDTQDTRDK